MFAQVDGKFSLTQPADHPKLEDYKVDDVARALEQLTFQAVQADADVTGSEVGHSVFTTKDGLAVNVTVLHVDKDAWARFTVSSSDDKVKAEAERLGGRLAGWTYQIGSWKERSLLPTIDDLKAVEPTRPAVQAMPVAPPGAMAPPGQWLRQRSRHRRRPHRRRHKRHRRRPHLRLTTRLTRTRSDRSRVSLPAYRRDRNRRDQT